MCRALSSGAAMTASSNPRLLSRKQRYLLCRPQGGLNDTLCQIEKCWKYAWRTNRLLIVDTRNSGLACGFSEFFELRKKSSRVIFDANEETLEFLNELTCYPVELRGKLHIMDMALFTPPNFVLKSNPSIPLSFDFSKEYQHAVLVHEQCGGGRLSLDLLEKIRISRALRPIILDRISHLHGKYCAVHVRNTDLKTDYKEFFGRILPEIQGKRLLVCSDDATVIEYARRFSHSLEILTSSEIPDTRGRALHYFGDRKKNAVDAIVDLIALGKSEKLYFTVHAGGILSGFSRLAEHLFRNKYVIQNLLQLPISGRRLTKWRVTLFRRQLKECLHQALHKARYFQSRPANRSDYISTDASQ